MNSRVRALVWEELRVGGPIAAVCLAVGLLLIVRVDVDGYYAGRWLRAGPSVLGFSLGIPLLCGLLLVLNLRNSGHLGGGFSRRILRLPINTAAAVTVTFGVRLAEMVALTLLLKLACWLLYRHGPEWDAVLLVVGAYAFIQMLDWMRAVLSWPLTALIGGAFALVVQYTGLLEWWDYLAGASWVLPPSPLVIAAWIALAFAVSMGLVVWTRRGECVTLWPYGAVAGTTKVGAPAVQARPFASVRAAHLWYHLRQNSLLLGKMTLLLWAGGVSLYWLVDFYTGQRHVDGHFTAWLFSMRSYFFFSQLMPFAALVCAAAGWRLVTGLGGRRGGKPSLIWTARLPLPGAEEARTRVSAAGINLAVMLGLVTLVYLAAYLLPDRFTAARLFGAVLAHGEASTREVLMALLGPALVFGLLAWVAMNLTGRLLLVYAATTAGMVLLWLGADSLDLLTRDSHHLRERLSFALVPFAVWFTGLAPVAMLAADLAVLGWLGWIRRRSIAACAALWAGIALLLYPFAWSLPPAAAQLAVVYCAGFAALAVLGWPERVLASAGGLWGTLHRENRQQHQRQMKFAFSGKQAVQMAALAAAVVGVAWLRWPAVPKVIEALHAQGLPATREEENEWYMPVPALENLANRYLDAVALQKKLEDTWMKQSATNPALQQAVKELKAKDALDNVLVQGGAKVKRTEPIPPGVWTTTLDYAKAVTGPVAAKLDEAAKSGLRQSRYAVDLRLGFEVLLPHLAELRVLAREGAVEAWVAAVEWRPEDAATAVLDLIPLANSLEGEPLLISQLVRMAIYGIAVDSLQTVMNRTELPEAMLARLQDGMKHAVPPLEQGPFLSRAMAGEEAVALSSQYNHWEADGYETLWSGRGAETKERSAYSLLRGVLECMGSDLIGMNRTERMVMARMQAANRDNASEAAKTGRLPGVVARYETTLASMSYHAPLSYVLLPALERAYESEWRVRTQLDMACTALAVERHRLANGRLPGRLEELVPSFLDRVPMDPWNDGKPLSYRVKENGEFVVYSFGRNGTDQKGEEVKENWWTNGDITFTVAPVEARERPQVADTPVAGV